MRATFLFVIFCVVFGLFWSFESLVCLLIVLFICLLYDLCDIIKALFFSCFYKVKRRFNPRKLLETNSVKAICLPTDVDFHLHLTERCLLQECDLALLKFWTENFVQDALYARQANIHTSGRYTRFQYPIRVFESFEIVTKVIFCDEKAFYVSQSILRNADKCLCASVLSVQQIVGTKISTFLGNKNTKLNKSEFETVAQTFQEFHSNYFRHDEASWKGL